MELGQQFGINAMNNHDLPFQPVNSYSLGNGISRQLLLHMYPDSSNWYVSAGFNHLGGNNVVTARQEDPASTDYKAATRTMNSLRFVTRVSYLMAVKRFNFSFSAGVIVPVISRTREEYWVRDTAGTSKTVSAVRNYATVGFNGALGISRKITPKISCFLNSDVQILSHQVKSRKITAYENSAGKNLESVYQDVASREIMYRRDIRDIINNREVFQQRFNKDMPTDKLSYRESASCIGVQVGFLFLF
jgi:hypothetical protein